MKTKKKLEKIMPTTSIPDPTEYCEEFVDYTEYNAKIAQEFWKRVESGECAIDLWRNEILVHGYLKKTAFNHFDFDKATLKITWKPETKNDLKFLECSTCSQKPGNPVLCDGCLNNRTVINELKKMIEEAGRS